LTILAVLIVVVTLVFIVRREGLSKEAQAQSPLALQAHPPTDSNPITSPSSTDAPSDTGLVKALNNMTYVFHNRNGVESVKMVNGKADTDGDSYGLGNVAIGDLNGDGKADAVAVIGESGGGSGNFEGLVAVVNNNGTIKNSEMFPLGDRVKINSLVVKDQVIIVDMITQGPDDPMCCPSQHQVLRLKLAGSQLTPTENGSETGRSSRQQAAESQATSPDASAVVEKAREETRNAVKSNLICKSHNPLADGRSLEMDTTRDGERLIASFYAVNSSHELHPLWSFTFSQDDAGAWESYDNSGGKATLIFAAVGGRISWVETVTVPGKGKHYQGGECHKAK
jgi:hypothetical protein